MTLFVMLPKSSLRTLPDVLIGEGRYAATTREIENITGSNADAVRHGLHRLRHQGRVLTPARGFHVMVPPEHRAWGTPPASWFIDAMMRHLERDYYVGLLSAAAHHGVSHQAAQAFQVVVDRHLEDRDFGRVSLRFYMSGFTPDTPTETVNTPTGTMVLSTREATVLDLVERPQESGGLSNVATIIRGIGSLDGQALADLSVPRKRAQARRLGWLLSQFRDDVELAQLRSLAARGGKRPVLLVPGGPRAGAVDKDWGVLINSTVEPEL